MFKLPKEWLTSEGLSKDEKRKRRKLIEQIQAYGVVALGAISVIVVLVLIVKLFTGGFHKEPDVEQVKEETVSVTSEEETTQKAEKEAEKKDSEDDADSEEGVSAAEQVKAATAKKKREEEAKAEKSQETDKEVILDKVIAQYIENMTIEEKVSGLFVVTPEQLLNTSKVTTAGGDVSTALSKYPVGGVLFTDKNMVDMEQFQKMVSNMRSYCRYETFMMACDEGGESSVFYKKGLVEEVIESQTQIAAEGGVAEAYSAGIAYGTQFRSFGLDVNLAPVADVTLAKNSAMTKRSYGSDIDDVLSLSKNTLKGMMDQSIHAAVKYFPSYGDVRSDGSGGRVSSNRTLEDLQANECVIYKELIEEGAEMIMVSTVCMPNIAKEGAPACFSSEIVTDILRTELEFDGIIMTDLVSKSAISKRYKQNAIAVLAIQAGCDMIVAPSNFRQQYQSVLTAVEEGTITEERIEESLYRIMRVKYENMIDYENYVE